MHLKLAPQHAQRIIDKRGFLTARKQLYVGPHGRYPASALASTRSTSTFASHVREMVLVLLLYMVRI
jgi:hypothetical protein